MKKIFQALVVLLLGIGCIGCTSFESFTENQLITEEIHYDSDGNVLSKKSFEYDNKGNLIRETIDDQITDYEYLDGKVVKAIAKDYVSDYVYENDNLIEVITKSNDKIKEIRKHEYNEKGKVTYSSLEKTDGEKTESYYTYDEKGQLVETSVGEYRTIYEYDLNGNCVKEISYIGDNADKEVTNTFENNLLVLQETNSFSNNSTITIKFEYNDQSQISKQFVSFDEQEFYKQIEYVYE